MKTTHYQPSVWKLSHCFQRLVGYWPRKGTSRVGQPRCAVVTDFEGEAGAHVWKMFGTLVAPAFRDRAANPLIKSHSAHPVFTEVIPTIRGMFTHRRDWRLHMESE